MLTFEKLDILRRDTADPVLELFGTLPIPYSIELAPFD
jgi:hypothetical protein